LLGDGQVAAALFNLRRAAAAIGETAEVLVCVARCQMQIDQLQDAQKTLSHAIHTRLNELGVDARSAANTATAEAAARATGLPPSALPGNLLGREDGDDAFARPAPAAPPAPGKPIVVPRDPLLSEAWTRLAQIELRRASNLSHTGLPESGNVLQAMISSGEPTTPRADACRETARRYLLQALAIRPDNRTARQLVEQLDATKANK
ncbi:MAG: hypothetical protein AB7K09_24755, partial [Planctomycetota bacterium]